MHDVTTLIQRELSSYLGYQEYTISRLLQLSSNYLNTENITYNPVYKAK
jgi:hypothetical protein